MSDSRARDQIESPCIKTCVIDPQARLCTGCLRSIDEITEWSRMAPATRRAVMDALPARRTLLASPPRKAVPRF